MKPHSRIATSLAVVAVRAALSVAGAGAQALPPQPQRYLLTTNVADARAVWVNPAALGRRLEASLGVDVSADRFAGGAQLSQYGATLASRGLALGWSHDRSPGGATANWYAIGLGLGNEAFSAGATRRWLRASGGVSRAYWDLALRADAGGWLQLSALARNVGSPAPRDSASAPVLVPAVSATVLGGLLDLGAECDVVARDWRTRAWRLGATLALTRGLALAIRADLTGDMGSSGFAVALQFDGPRSRASGFVATTRGLDRIEGGGVAGALVARRPGAR